nr:hypothetical protein [Salinigranum salinum]
MFNPLPRIVDLVPLEIPNLGACDAVAKFSRPLDEPVVADDGITFEFIPVVEPEAEIVIDALSSNDGNVGICTRIRTSPES